MCWHPTKLLRNCIQFQQPNWWVLVNIQLSECEIQVLRHRNIQPCTCYTKRWGTDLFICMQLWAWKHLSYKSKLLTESKTRSDIVCRHVWVCVHIKRRCTCTTQLLILIKQPTGKLHWYNCQPGSFVLRTGSNHQIAAIKVYHRLQYNSISPAAIPPTRLYWLTLCMAMAAM